MSTPFTQEQFLDVFGAYNESLWLFAIALWVLTAFAIVRLFHYRTGSAFINVVLVILWTWAGVAYHAAFFSRLTPVAWLFSGLFLTEAALLAWYGVIHARVQFSAPRSFRHFVSWGLAGYALLYPVVVRADGLTFPRLPTFGVPCPTAILTIALLLATNGTLPRFVTVIPILWAFIGGSAAFLFGVHADVVLLAAGIVLAAFQIAQPGKGTSKIEPEPPATAVVPRKFRGSSGAQP
jgi:hypothetical protein